jgi:hypothetical protein
MGDGRAEALVRRWYGASRALDGGLRVAYLRAEMEHASLADVAEALDRVCLAAEQAEPAARELLVSVVDMLAAGEQSLLAERLREEALGRSLLALGRLLRRPPPPRASTRPAEGPNEARVPDYGTGRTLTLGERKALARRPTRAGMDKLFADPHPMVIRTLLANPKVVEDDVIRLAARRPNRPEVLAEIARSARWAHRVRVRMSIVLNPDSPIELSIPLLTLLVRSELRLVKEAEYLAPVLRATAGDLLARRPPSRHGSPSGKLQ